ncbi:MAG TPA: HU family DNA-binding protein [Candidatus Atribacteria bacterium]|nr:HU family DNA-binding protein [Candidatus Atribacteria bacterium]
MNKQELVNTLSEELKKEGVNVTKKDTAKIVDTFLGVIQEEIKRGGKVQLVGFGTFGVKTRAARRGRNPQTGKEIRIPEATIPFFRPGKGLKELVKE